MADRGIREIGLDLLEWAIDCDDADPETVLGLARLVASGTVVLAVGIGIALRAYARAGFRWPSEVKGG
jgi:hypothetical protein